MIAWLEENLKAYTARFGEWVTWSYQKDNSHSFFNPLICIQTAHMEKINEDLKVLVKGKNLMIRFKEVDTIEDFLDKLDPMRVEEFSAEEEK